MTSELQKQALDKQVHSIQRAITGFTVVAWICVGLGLVAAGFGLWRLFHESSPDRFSWANIASLGSYLQGAVASIWSLAGLLFIYVAFLGQKQQLLLQNEQLADQKRQFEAEQKGQEEQLKAQQEQFRQQLASMKRQSFESTFFQLVNLHNQIVSAMRDVDRYRGHTEAEQELRGRDCFKPWYESFRKDLWGCKIRDEGGGVITIEEHPKTVADKYLAFYQAHQAVLGHYFRNLYHLFKFVDESEIEDKRRYTSLARAQLSQYELALLFYNGLTAIPPETENKFKRRIQDFGLLENLDRKLLLKPEDEKLYDPKAFK